MRQSKGSWGGNPSCTSQIILFFMSGLSTESSWSCPEGCRGWETHQGFIPALSCFTPEFLWNFFLFQSPFGCLLWSINAGSSRPLPDNDSWLMLVLLQPFLLRACVERNQQHQGKILGIFISTKDGKHKEKLENNPRHLLPMPVP